MTQNDVDILSLLSNEIIDNFIVIRRKHMPECFLYFQRHEFYFTIPCKIKVVLAASLIHNTLLVN